MWLFSQLMFKRILWQLDLLLTLVIAVQYGGSRCLHMSWGKTRINTILLTGLSKGPTQGSSPSLKLTVQQGWLCSVCMLSEHTVGAGGVGVGDSVRAPQDCKWGFILAHLLIVVFQAAFSVQLCGLLHSLWFPAPVLLAHGNAAAWPGGGGRQFPTLSVYSTGSQKITQSCGQPVSGIHSLAAPAVAFVCRVRDNEVENIANVIFPRV